MSRQAILVLGMHRSGTSALTRIIGLMGATLPRDPMPATEDNREGYFESRSIARFNNQLLERSGTRWNDDGAIRDPGFDADTRAAGRELLEQVFGADGVFVFKDPRLCRLLPFWKAVLAESGSRASAVVMLRDPVEVMKSLAARRLSPQFRAGAVAAPSRGLLLWLRHVLEAERHTRDLPRCFVEYAQLLGDWRAALAPLGAIGPLTVPVGGATAEAIDGFLQPGLRRQRGDGAATVDPGPEVRWLRSLPGVLLGLGPRGSAGAEVPDPGTLPGRVAVAAAEPAGFGVADRDALAADLDRLVDEYRPLRAGQDPLSDHDVWSDAILREIHRLTEAGPAEPIRRHPTALFLSGAPDSIGHVYRVRHPVAALAARGWQASWLPIDDPLVEERLGSADLVVVFRARWDEAFGRVHDACRRRGVPLVYDIDDLIFDPDLMERGYFAYLERLDPAGRRRWIADAAAYREALSRCTAAVLTTAPLAAAAARVCPRVRVLPNGLGEDLLAAADAVRVGAKPSDADGRPRLGFASGTPTHQRDFGTIAPVLVECLDRHPAALLTIVGHLDLSAYPALAAHRDRIETRPSVAFRDLCAEVARFDVNLAPLEVGNPFCEAKSEVRVTVAAAVGVPSVAAATVPLGEAILGGETGLLATDAVAWTEALGRLLGDAAGRRRMGDAARRHVRGRFGWGHWSSLAVRTYSGLLSP